MLKNKFKLYAAVAFIAFIIPGNLLAQGSFFSLEKYSLFLAIDTLTFLEKILPLVSILFAALLKSWFLKRRLSLPWKVGPIEKLGVASLAETVVESFFFGLLFLFFIPALTALLKDIAPLGAEITPGQFFLRLLLILGVILPYQLVVGTLLNMLLIHLLAPMEKGEYRRYFKYAFISGAMFPLLLIVSIFSRFLLLLFKSG